MVGGNASDASSFANADGSVVGGAAGVTSGMPSAEERRVLQWIAQLMDTERRESALLELSKKREQFPQLALILWHSFGQSTLAVVATGGAQDFHVRTALSATSANIPS